MHIRHIYFAIPLNYYKIFEDPFSNIFLKIPLSGVENEGVFE